MLYMVKTPGWLKAIYPSLQWEAGADDKKIYLSFDDGPHPEITPTVLQWLDDYKANACFFCIGENVQKHPNTYDLLKNSRHSIGNHTYNHLNGWQTPNEVYYENIRMAAELIHSRIFRPPYGKITKTQAKYLAGSAFNLRTVMWSLVSGDFDESITKEKCLKNVVQHSRPGSIIVFHDSEKAWPRLQYALPKTLEYFAEKGYTFEKIE